MIYKGKVSGAAEGDRLALARVGGVLVLGDGLAEGLAGPVLPF